MTIEEAARRLDIHTMFITAIITALTFVVGLFWNDAVRSAIELALPERETVGAKFVAASIITLVVIFIAFVLYKTHEVTQRYEKALRKRIKKL